MQWRSWSPGGLARFLHEMYRALRQRQVEPDSVPGYIEALQMMCLDPECAVDGTTEEDSYGNGAPVFTEDWALMRTKLLCGLVAGKGRFSGGLIGASPHNN
jgi:hypothetical protein